MNVSKTNILGPAILAITVAAAALADDQGNGSKPAQLRSDSAGAINTICPDSGDKVGTMGKPVYVSYHGKKIALCCQQCRRDFEKNQEKHSALAEKNGSATDGR